MPDFKTLLAVGDVMNTQFASIREDNSVLSGAALMAKSDVNALLITNGNGELAGIVTEQDIVRRAVGADLEVKTCPLSQIMSVDPVQINSDESIFEARNIMTEKKLNHLVVVQDGQPIGILTAANVLGG